MIIVKLAIRVIVIVGLSISMCSPTFSAEPRTQVDHIILGVSDLEQGVTSFERLTGVRPVYGGKHPGGTHNALASLGGGVYLEIIAVQPGATPPPHFASLANMKNLTPVGWAVSSTDIAHLRSQLEPAHLDLTEASSGSRATPAGATLSWQTLGLKDAFEEAPFFIVWAPQSPHPSTTSPSGCTLLRWRIAGPGHKTLDTLRRALDLSVEVADAPTPALRLSLACPKGTVTFDSASVEP